MSPQARTIKAAAVQMDASPAPLRDRLARAETLIEQAAQEAAEIVVLPELFNSGYEYHHRNYSLAEPITGETVTWMKVQAAKHGLHLMGTLLLRDGADIFNSALLIAPDGRTWRYDKNYPFVWERAYFRDGTSITVADTDLGRLGMLICWDAAHPQLWQRYAGQVDAMLVSSCPPKLSSADLVFADGQRVNLRDLGPIWGRIYTDEEHFPGHELDDQARWLGVPVVATVGGGTFRSRLPLSIFSALAYFISRPDLLFKPGALNPRIEAGFDRQTKIVDAKGQVLSRVQSDRDGLTVADVRLGATPPQPRSEQPKMWLENPPNAVIDQVGARAMIGLYRWAMSRREPSRPLLTQHETRQIITWGLVLLTAALLIRRTAQRRD